MTDIRISVLTYVKNDAAHIGQCMRSVMAQDMDDMEYLVIDGGSTDGTREIIEELSKEDDRIRIIDSEPGLGHQFNVGVREAAGEYIGICESDDYILPGMYKYQYEIAKKYELDILRADAYDFFGPADDEHRIPFRLPGVSDLRERLLTGDDAGQAIRMGVNRFFSGLYKRSFIIDNELFMNETPGAAYQDNTFSFLTLISAERIYISDRAFYCYRLDNPNASCNSPDRLNLVDVEYHLLYERLKKSGHWEEHKECYLSWLILNHLWFCNLLSGELLNKEIGIFYNALRELTADGSFKQDKLRDQDIQMIRAAETSEECFSGIVTGICERIASAKERLAELTEDDTVIIFGCGNIGRLVLYALKKRGITPAGFTDNNSALWGTQIEGVAVMPPQEAYGHAVEAEYIVANVEHNAEIRKQLSEHGVKEEKMIVCDSYDYTARRILMEI